MISIVTNKPKHYTQPSRCGTGGLWSSLSQPLNRVTVRFHLRCLSITNEQNKSYTSDLDMT